MNDLGFIAFPAIVVLCYLVGATLKAVNNETTVDAVTGATVTSTAVSKMLQEKLTEYKDFLKK